MSPRANRRHALRAIVGALLAAAAADVPAGEAPALRPFDANSLDGIRHTHAGRPFVIVFWSVTCEPCREELAEWGPLQRRHPDIPILLVSTDGEGDRALVRRMLAKHPLAGVQAWMFADEMHERVRFSVDRKWRGELPRTYFFDRQHRAEGRTGKVDPGWLAQWLQRQRGGRT